MSFKNLYSTFSIFYYQPRYFFYVIFKDKSMNIVEFQGFPQGCTADIAKCLFWEIKHCNINKTKLLNII